MMNYSQPQGWHHYNKKCFTVLNGVVHVYTKSHPFLAKLRIQRGDLCIVTRDVRETIFPNSKQSQVALKAIDTNLIMNSYWAIISLIHIHGIL